MDPDFIYLADKIKIDVVRLRFDSPTKQNTTAKLTSKTNIHRFRCFAWYICVVFDREKKKFNFHLHWNICLFFICFVCCLWHAIRNRNVLEENMRRIFVFCSGWFLYFFSAWFQVCTKLNNTKWRRTKTIKSHSFPSVSFFWP